MRTLSRYFVARYLALFLAILAIGVCVLVAVDALLGNVGQLGHAAATADAPGNPAKAIVIALLHRAFTHLPDLLPLAAFVAAFITLALSARWQELMASGASGISPLQVARPILLTAAALAALALLAVELLRSPQSPLAHGRIHAAQAAEELDRVVFRRGAFWFHEGTSIYKIGEADPASRRLSSVEIFDRTASGRLLRSITSNRVDVTPDGRWTLHDALVRDFDPTRPDRGVAIQRVERLDRVVRARHDVLAETDAANLPLLQLREAIRARELNPHQVIGVGQSLPLLRTLLHLRLSDALLIFLFSLIALAVALRIQPGHDLSRAGLAAVAVIALFYLSRAIGINLAHAGIVSGALAIWGVIALFSLGSGWLLLRAGRPL